MQIEERPGVSNAGRIADLLVFGRGDDGSEQLLIVGFVFDVRQRVRLRVDQLTASKSQNEECTTRRCVTSNPTVRRLNCSAARRSGRVSR